MWRAFEKRFRKIFCRFDIFQKSSLEILHKRYFYIDNQGQKHWVDPSVVDRYNVSKDPSEQGWEGTTYWDDYELTGLADLNNPSEKPLDKELIPEEKKQSSITPNPKLDKETIYIFDSLSDGIIPTTENVFYV